MPMLGLGVFQSPPADRGKLFVTTRLWFTDYGYDAALIGFEGCLRRLGIDFVDLFLLHQPVPTDFGRTVAAYKARPSQAQLV